MAKPRSSGCTEGYTHKGRQIMHCKHRHKLSMSYKGEKSDKTGNATIVSDGANLFLVLSAPIPSSSSFDTRTAVPSQYAHCPNRCLAYQPSI